MGCWKLDQGLTWGRQPIWGPLKWCFWTHWDSHLSPVSLVCSSCISIHPDNRHTFRNNWDLRRPQAQLALPGFSSDPPYRFLTVLWVSNILLPFLSWIPGIPIFWEWEVCSPGTCEGCSLLWQCTQWVSTCLHYGQYNSMLCSEVLLFLIKNNYLEVA